MGLLSLLTLATFLIVSIIVLSIFIWPKINIVWLENICSLIVISMPFERIPSLNFGIGNTRISQLLVLFGIYILVLLIAKKDKIILNTKIKSENIVSLSLIFVILTTSLYAQDLNRYFQTTLATILAFGAFFLISTFTKNIIKRMVELTLTLSIVNIFGLYQVIGDFLGLSTEFTGLRIQYTKAIFGIARIHATALEPLYYAGMLFLPIIFITFIIFFSDSKWKYSFYQDIGFNERIMKSIFSLSNLCIFGVVFLLTLSKSAWLSIFIAFIIGIWLFVRYFDLKVFLNNIIKLRATLAKIFGFLIIVFTLGMYAFSNIFNNIFLHLEETLLGNSGTIVERNNFVNDALKILPENLVLGIGNGQYGVYVKDYFKRISDGFLIVNNIYIEVFLELGFFGILLFIILLTSVIISGMLRLSRKLDFTTKICYISLILALVAYLIQWASFSPIYIMPIFIILGLLSRLNSQEFIDKE
jgi:hypothetical protein